MVVNVCIGKVLNLWIVGGVVVNCVFLVGIVLSFVRCLMMWIFLVRRMLCVGCFFLFLVLLMFRELMLISVILVLISDCVVFLVKKGVFELYWGVLKCLFYLVLMSMVDLVRLWFLNVVVWMFWFFDVYVLCIWNILVCRLMRVCRLSDVRLWLLV